MIKILELFAGIGACSKALKNLKIEHEIVDAVEIDKYAIRSFNAIHNTDFIPQDIVNWNKNIKVDLIMHGSPCQDFSIAGKQAGGDKDSGTRSSLMYETIRIIENLKPKYVLWENVKNLLSKKHIHNFKKYLESLEELGYNNYYQILNARDYGIPQNRERVFTVSIRKDIDDKSFKFPEKQELRLRLKDMLESSVDEKFFLDDKKIKNYTRNFGSKGKMQNDICSTLRAAMGIGGGNVPIIRSNRCIQVGQMYGTEKEPNPQAGRIYNSDGISPTMDSCSGGNRMPKILIKNATKKGYLIASDGDSINLAYPHSKTRRARVGKQISQTLQCSSNMGVISDFKIRKLTPKECWRLMGFSDETFEKAAKVNSNTQLYKQAGNSIVVNVLEKILSILLLNK